MKNSSKNKLKDTINFTVFKHLQPINDSNVINIVINNFSVLLKTKQ
jgi:hypothetical protein